MAGANAHIKMVNGMKENGLMINQTEREDISIVTEIDIRVS